MSGGGYCNAGGAIFEDDCRAKRFALLTQFLINISRNPFPRFVYILAATGTLPTWNSLLQSGKPCASCPRGCCWACFWRGFASRNLHGFWGVIKSVAIGVPLPLCSCGVIPAGIGLKKDGASDGSAVAFLISTPQTGVDSVLVSASFFGLPFAIYDGSVQ